MTIDLDATQVEVYGAHKQGARRNRHGQMSYAPHVAFWAQTGRALTGELVGGNREKLSGAECARIATRALGLLPAGHGPATFRVDSAYYQLELLERLRQQRLAVYRLGAQKPGDVEGAGRDPRGCLAGGDRDAGGAGRRDHLPP